ncbi:MAG: nicotinate-nucleotide--dimethylbenzimidazole phosphoribosyltransferase [Planctomycetota bacterium]
MTKLEQIIKQIKSLDKNILKSAQKRLDSLTKPLGSLGRLEELAKQIAGITWNMKPTITDKTIVLMAGDHGVASEGVSAYPQEVTAQMVLNILGGGAAINVLSRHIGAKLVVVDMGVASDIPFHSELLVKKIGKGTANMTYGPAMSYNDALRAIETGIEIAESEAEKGTDIIATGEMGIANTTPSSAIAAVLTGSPVEVVTGRGTGIDDKRRSKKIAVIEKSIEANKPDSKDSVDVLAKIGGFEIGGLAGVILGAAGKKIPVVIDGFISSAAALIAAAIAPAVKEYMIASHCSVEPGHKLILEYMGLKPLLSLDMRLGEGSGAALGINLAETAVKIFNEMATFGEAGVSEKAD